MPSPYVEQVHNPIVRGAVEVLDSVLTEKNAFFVYRTSTRAVKNKKLPFYEELIQGKILNEYQLTCCVEVEHSNPLIDGRHIIHKKDLFFNGAESQPFNPYEYNLKEMQPVLKYKGLVKQSRPVKHPWAITSVKNS